MEPAAVTECVATQGVAHTAAQLAVTPVAAIAVARQHLVADLAAEPAAASAGAAMQVDSAAADMPAAVVGTAAVDTANNLDLRSFPQIAVEIRKSPSGASRRAFCCPEQPNNFLGLPNVWLVNLRARIPSTS
jgi:hypothetical protein